MDQAALQERFDEVGETGARLWSSANQGVVGLASTIRVVRPLPGGAGAWVLWRDTYWLGEQSATHLLRVTNWRVDGEDLILATDRGELIVEFAPPADAAIITEFRKFAARADSGYGPEAEARQMVTVAAMLDEMDAAA